MNVLTIVVSVIGMMGTVTSIFYTFHTSRRNSLRENKEESKNEGVMLSDIVYIKLCVARVEKNLNKVDEQYHNTVERLSKVEESLANVIKRIDEM